MSLSHKTYLNLHFSVEEDVIRFTVSPVKEQSLFSSKRECCYYLLPQTLSMAAAEEHCPLRGFHTQHSAIDLQIICSKQCLCLVLRKCHYWGWGSTTDRAEGGWGQRGTGWVCDVWRSDIDFNPTWPSRPFRGWRCWGGCTVAETGHR